MTDLPVTARPGPLNLITDVGGLLVGSAHDAAVGDRRHGDPRRRRGLWRLWWWPAAGPARARRMRWAPDTLVDAMDAIVFSGGSVYGLAAADGVTAALGAAGQGFALFPNSAVPVSPIVPAAILYDLANGGDKAWGETPPYRALGMRR